jgi:hypothetical protein
MRWWRILACTTTQAGDNLLLLCCVTMLCTQVGSLGHGSLSMSAEVQRAFENAQALMRRASPNQMYRSRLVQPQVMLSHCLHCSSSDPALEPALAWIVQGLQQQHVTPCIVCSPLTSLTFSLFACMCWAQAVIKLMDTEPDQLRQDVIAAVNNAMNQGWVCGWAMAILAPKLPACIDHCPTFVTCTASCCFTMRHFPELSDALTAAQARAS